MSTLINLSPVFKVRGRGVYIYLLESLDLKHD